MDTSEAVDIGSQNLGKNTSTDEDNKFSEDEAEIPAGVNGSMLTSPYFVNESEREHIFNLHQEKVIDLSVFLNISTQ